MDKITFLKVYLVLLLYNIIYYVIIFIYHIHKENFDIILVSFICRLGTIFLIFVYWYKIKLGYYFNDAKN